MSAQQLAEWLSRSLSELDLPVVMIDGIHFRGRVILVALGIDAKGNKHVLGLREGSTEATRVVRSLLSDLVERGPDADRARLRVIDGGKALRKPIVECFGALAVVQRCQERKRRNLLDHLPEDMHASVGRALRDAWDSANADSACKQLKRLAASLHAKHPGAAASLREGLDETLTVQPMGITGALYRTLRTTNPIENLNGSIAHYTRNVKRWRDGQMTLRWIASALSQGQGQLPQAARASRHEGSLGISQQMVASYEVGRRRIPVSMLQALASALSVDIDTLLGSPAAKARARRGPAPTLARHMERISALPKTQQKFVIQVLESVLAQASMQASVR